MSDHPLGSRAVTQIGIIVKDIEKAVELYSHLLSVEPPPIDITSGFEKANTHYNGLPTHAKAKLAFFNLGQVQLELIEPIGEDSTWKAHLDNSGETVHHIAFEVPNTDQAIAYLGDQGLPVEQQGDYTGGRYTYIDSRDQLGVALELLENFKS